MQPAPRHDAAVGRLVPIGRRRLLFLLALAAAGQATARPAPAPARPSGPGPYMSFI